MEIDQGGRIKENYQHNSVATRSVSRIQFIVLTFGWLIVINFFASCASHCKTETLPLPPQSLFIKHTAAVDTIENPVSVWQTKSPGKPVVLLHALNGISPSLLQFALELEKWGCRVYLPSLYGDPIMGEPAYGYDMALDAIKFLKTDPRWRLHETDDAGPILDETMAITSWVAGRETREDLTVIGNCLTGNFPLALLEHPRVKTAVLSQPALPVLKNHEVFLRIPQSAVKQRSLAVSDQRIKATIAALRKNPEKQIIGFHYVHDPLASVLKFDELNRVLGEHGEEEHFRAFVLGRKSSSGLWTGKSWVSFGLTEERKKMLTPHSTIVNPETVCDRDWFRDRLRETLFPDYSPK